MTNRTIRIFSDLHYGDRASTLTALQRLRPLFDGATEIVINGDALDTRPGPDPAATVALQAEVRGFFGDDAPATTLLTGNHDPDVSEQHALEFAGRQVFVTHGDVLFEDLVPWSRDAIRARQLVAAELAAIPAHGRETLAEQFGAYRRAAAALPQRHQSEPHGLRYALGFAADTIWPPSRVLRVLRAWRDAPRRADGFLERHSLPATFFVMGHTHRLGVTHTARGVVVLNTGSFCPPCGCGFVEITADSIALRRIGRRRGEYCVGDTVAQFALAGTPVSPTLAP